MHRLAATATRRALKGAAFALTLAALALCAAWATAPAAHASGPVLPVPTGLWTPPASALPASGDYVYLASDPGDYIGQGKTYLYTKADAVLGVTTNGAFLSVTVNGDEWWTGQFRAMSSLSQLQAGYYPGLTRYPFEDTSIGGFDWYGEGRGSNTLTAWVAIDGVTYSGSTLTAIDLRFELHSEGGTPALHGAIHWQADDPTQPPGPVLPVPAALWKPPASALPASGDYVYLASDPGDWIGQGRTYLYTKADAVLGATTNGALLSVTVNGDESWTGDFLGMSSLARLQPGLYPGLQRYPFNNPTKGGLEWYGEGRGSNTLTGWFAVDSVTYSGSTLTAIDLRFELHSEGGTPALHGAIHWQTDDPTQPPGPLLPVPSGLWQPSPSAIPSSGDYIYLDSDAGDWIGQGQEYLYTPSDADISVSANSGHLDVSVSGSEWWYGDFQAMNSLTRLQPGLYSGLQRYPFNNPTKGGLDWYGEGRGSNTLTGWFAVDSVTYTNGVLTAIDLRFELHSEGGTPALHGEIRWGTGEPSRPPFPTPTPTATTTPTPPSLGGTRTTLGLSTPLVCDYGAANLSGTLAGADARALAGAIVTVRAYAGGVWSTIGSTTTDGSGAFVFAVAPTVISTYQASFAGDTKYAGSTSPTASLFPKAFVTAPALPRTVRGGAAFTCSCSLMPRHLAGSAPLFFECQRHIAGRWLTKKTVAAVAADAGGSSLCTATVRLPTRGAWRIRSLHPTDAQNYAAASAWSTIRVN